jgi:hypothetical protein
MNELLQLLEYGGVEVRYAIFVCVRTEPYCLRAIGECSTPSKPQLTLDTALLTHPS